MTTEGSDMTVTAIVVLTVWMSYHVTKRLDIVMTDVTQGILTVTAKHVSSNIDYAEPPCKTM